MKKQRKKMRRHGRKVSRWTRCLLYFGVAVIATAVISIYINSGNAFIASNIDCNNGGFGWGVGNSKSDSDNDCDYITHYSNDYVVDVMLDIVIEHDWRLILVNRDNPVPLNHEMTLYYVENGFLFDSRAVKPLQNMLASMRKEGLSPIIVSTYRCYQTQKNIYENRVANLMHLGKTLEEAKKEAKRFIAPPGFSEHQIGLAVDIVSFSYQNLSQNFSYTPEGIWLAQNSADYGFILRYPKYVEDITGISYEPWHFRYVGIEAAKIIRDMNITLEEFIIVIQ